MKAKEPAGISAGVSTLLPHLRHRIVERVEEEKNLSVLEQIYSIIASGDSFEEKYRLAKEQTERYCAPELAEQLEAEGYMIDKAYPYDDTQLDLDQLRREDAEDGDAPQEWLEKMFPELYA